MTLLHVENLRTWVDSERGPIRAVDGVDLDIDAGRTLGVSASCRSCAVPPAADGNCAALAAVPSDGSPDDIIAVLDADARIASEFLRQATGTWSTAMWPSPPGAG